MAKIVVTLESAKDRFTLARKAACSADRLAAALFDRLAAETLLAAKGQPAERAATMFFRMAVALEVLAERKAWPDRIAGLPNRRQSPRATADAVFGEVEAES